MWGTLFAAGQDAELKGVLAGMWKLSSSPSIAALRDPVTAVTAEARFCFLAWRSRGVYEIFASVFGVDARRRLKLVIASQSVNPAVSRSILTCNSSYVASVASVLAIAPYFGAIDESTNTQGWTPEFVFNATLQPNFAVINATTRAHAALARSMGLELATYEAGQGFLGGSASSQALVVAVNAHPLMRGAYASYLRMLTAAGVGLVNLFSCIGLDSQYGTWGLVLALDYDPATSYKLQGVSDVVASSLQCSPIREPANCPLAISAASGAAELCGGPAQGLCVDTPSPSSSSPGAACECRAGFGGADCSDHAIVDVSTCSYRKKPYCTPPPPNCWQFPAYASSARHHTKRRSSPSWWTAFTHMTSAPSSTRKV